MFTPFRLRDLTLANRVVVSPMSQYSAVDGMPNDWHFVHLGTRAVGGAGLVFAEMTDVSPEGRISPGCPGLWSEEQAIAWKRIVDFVHRERCQDRRAARTRRTQGRHPADVGGDVEPLEAGGVADPRAVGAPVFSAQPGADARSRAPRWNRW